MRGYLRRSSTAKILNLRSQGIRRMGALRTAAFALSRPVRSGFLTNVVTRTNNNLMYGVAGNCNVNEHWSWLLIVLLRSVWDDRVIASHRNLSRQRESFSTRGFAWLPSRTFPMASDEVFRLAASQIRDAIDNDVTYFVMSSMVNREDHILAANTFSRAKLGGQVGGALDFEETLITLNADVALHCERESISLLMNKISWAELMIMKIRFEEVKSLEICKGRPFTQATNTASWSRDLAQTIGSFLCGKSASNQCYSSGLRGHLRTQK